MGTGLLLTGAVVTGITTIVTALTTATVRIITTKGKYRAAAADVLIDTAINDRLRILALQRDKDKLLAALNTLVAIIEGGVKFQSVEVAATLQAAAVAAKRAAAKMEISMAPKGDNPLLEEDY